MINIITLKQDMHKNKILIYVITKFKFIVICANSIPKLV